MARINEIGAHRIAYPDRLGETVKLYIHISKKDAIYINDVKISLPDECYNVTFETLEADDKI